MINTMVCIIELSINNNPGSRANRYGIINPATANLTAIKPVLMELPPDIPAPA